MIRYLKLSAISVFVIAYYIQIANSQSTNSTDISENVTVAKTEATTAGPTRQQFTHQIKSILYQDEEISYDDFLSRNPQRIEIKSDKYPNFYPGPSSQNWSIYIESGTGIDITIHDLDLNPASDYLFIRNNADANSLEKGIMYSGNPVDLPIQIRMLSTESFYLQFVSTAANTLYRGFLITYAAYSEIPVVTEPPITEFPINNLPLEFITVHLEIPYEQQNNDTWETLRILFSDMANKYIVARNISANESLPEYVVFQSIRRCPSSWRNADSCMTVEFALPVPIVLIDEDDTENEYKFNVTNFKYELTETKLHDMWSSYASEILSDKGILIFEKQNALILLMWVGISLAIITAFLIVLYCIWRMDELNAYRRFRNKRSDSLSQDNISKPSIMEEQARYYLEPPPFFDEDAHENHDHMYSTNTTISNNNLFVIADDEVYPTSKQSFTSLHQSNNRAPNANGLPKSALKNSKPMMPAQYSDNSPKEDNDDGGRIIINTESLQQARPKQQLFLPDDTTFEESNS